MFKLKFAAYNVLNNTIIIIKLISYSCVIIYFDNSLYLNLSTSVRFKAKITLVRPVVSAVPLCTQTNFIVPLCPHVYIYTYVGTIFNSLYVSW